ncbi:MAG TPA: hypothetical protein VFT72_04070 [Opitutaceae bacterium]|nr:hypothetical protein [Opitutaceae bacterium]
MRFSFLPLALVLAAFSGCSSVKDSSFSESVRAKFSAPQYHTYVIHADQRKTYEAAKAALKPMDFRFLNGGPNQGKISAINGISSDNNMRSAHQVSLDVRLSPVADGTEVAALFSHITEDDSVQRLGTATIDPIREDGIYDNYFAHIEQALAAQPK